MRLTSSPLTSDLQTQGCHAWFAVNSLAPRVSTWACRWSQRIEEAQSRLDSDFTACIAEELGGTQHSRSTKTSGKPSVNGPINLCFDGSCFEKDALPAFVLMDVHFALRG